MSLELFDVNAALQALKNKIAPPPTKVTNPTKTEKECHLSEMSEKSEMSEALTIEKSLFQTKYTNTYFLTNAQGRPALCIHCSAWTQGKGVWWSGSCLHTDERKSNKSRCTIEVWEVA